MNKTNNNENIANINRNSQSTPDNQITQNTRIVRQVGKLFSLLFAAALIVSALTLSPAYAQVQDTTEISTSQTRFPVEEQKECKDKTWLEALYEFFGVQDKIRAECEQNDLMNGRLRR